MENIILNTWIEIKKGLKIRLTEKLGKDDCSFLIMEIDDNGNVSKKALIVKGRKVFDNSGKMMITKKFISAWM